MTVGPPAERPQTWLLGYEFPSMLMVLLKDRLICVGSAQKSPSLGCVRFR